MEQKRFLKNDDMFFLIVRFKVNNEESRDA